MTYSNCPTVGRYAINALVALSRGLFDGSGTSRRQLRMANLTQDPNFPACLLALLQLYRLPRLPRLPRCR